MHTLLVSAVDAQNLQSSAQIVHDIGQYVKITPPFYIIMICLYPID